MQELYYCDQISFYDNSKGFIEGIDKNVSISVLDEASITACYCKNLKIWGKAKAVIYRSKASIYSKDVVLKTYNSDIFINTTSAFIYSKNSIITVSKEFDTKNVITDSGSKLFVNDGYKDNDYHKNYVNPKKFLSPNRIFYKCVEKVNNKYYSFYNNAYEYKIGKMATPDFYDNNPIEICAGGIHIAGIEWALEHYYDRKEVAILEVEVPEDADITVPYTSDGKLRASKVKVLREVPVEEFGKLGEFYKKFC